MSGGTLQGHHRQQRHVRGVPSERDSAGGRVRQMRYVYICFYGKTFLLLCFRVGNAVLTSVLDFKTLVEPLI